MNNANLHNLYFNLNVSIVIYLRSEEPDCQCGRIFADHSDDVIKNYMNNKNKSKNVKETKGKTKPDKETTGKAKPEIWDCTKHTSTFTTDAFGEIDFGHEVRALVRYIINGLFKNISFWA